MTEPVPRFRVVPRHPGFPARGWIIAIAIAWLLSLAGAWALATWFAAPGLGDTRGQLRTAERTAAQQQRQLEELSQRMVTLSRSDQISRAANTELQSSLAERDE